MFLVDLRRARLPALRGLGDSDAVQRGRSSWRMALQRRCWEVTIFCFFVCFCFSSGVFLLMLLLFPFLGGGTTTETLEGDGFFRFCVCVFLLQLWSVFVDAFALPEWWHYNIKIMKTTTMIIIIKIFQGS